MGRLWFHLHGYVIIRVKGSRLENFLNMVNREGIQLWDVSRPVPDRLYCSVSVADFRRLRPIVKALHLAVDIRRRQGLPFWLGRIFQRKALVAGGLLFLLAMYLLSGYVWFISLASVPTAWRSQVAEIAAQAGLRPGVRKVDLNPREIEKALLQQIEDLSWVAVEFRGTAAFVEAVERTTFAADRNQPSHLVAAKSGLVQSVITFAGCPTTYAGVTVRTGDVLVSGVIPLTEAVSPLLGQAGHWGYLYADGIVEAITWYEGTAVVKYQERISRRTGRKSTGYRLSWPGFTITLGRKAIPYVEFETEETFWQNFSLTRTIYYELKTEIITREPDQAKKEALVTARSKVKLQVPDNGKILDEQVEIRLDEDRVEVGVVVTVLENIGVNSPIKVGDPPPTGLEGIVIND